MIRIGALKNKITIQEPISVADSYGSQTITWTDRSNCVDIYSWLRPLGSSERIDAMKMQHNITHSIRIRYRSGISPKMRILFGERIFEIVSVINFEERNEYLDLLAEERV